MFFSPLCLTPLPPLQHPAVSNTYVSMKKKTWTEEHEKCICCHVLPIQWWGRQSDMPIKDKTANIHTHRHGLECKNPSKTKQAYCLCKPPQMWHFDYHITRWWLAWVFRGTRVWRDGAFFTPFLIRPHEPYFSEDNSNTFKVRMCIPELKRAKSTIPLECIRDSSTLACLKKNTLAQLFLFCPSLMANTFSLNGFHNKRCGWRTGDGEIFSRLEGFAMLWAEDARNYWSGSGWRGMINSLDSIFGA